VFDVHTYADHKSVIFRYFDAHFPFWTSDLQIVHVSCAEGSSARSGIKKPDEVNESLRSGLAIVRTDT
jgi:hypothetical protein